MRLEEIFPDIRRRSTAPAARLDSPACLESPAGGITSRRAQRVFFILVGGAALAILLSQSRTSELAVAGVLGVALLLFGARYSYQHPEWLIIALAIEETVPYLNVIPVDPAHRWFLRYPLLLAVTLPAAWLALKSGILWQGRFKSMMWFWVWAALTVPYSLVPVISLGRLIPNVLVFLTLCAVVLSVKSAEDVQTILGKFLLACGVLMIGTGIAYLFLPAVLGGSQAAHNLRATWVTDESGIYRFTGLFSDANSIGALLMATLTVAVAHWHAVSKTRRKVLILLLVGAGLFFAVMADSRSETAVALLGCTLYVIWKYRFKGILLIGILATCAVLAYSYVPRANRVYLNRNVSTLTGRTMAWKFELQKLKERPFLGYGYEVRGEIFQSKYFPNWQKFWDRGPNTSLHEAYLSMAVGMGIPALVFWLVVFLGPWLTLWRSGTDTWNLKPLVFFVLIPSLLLGLDESGLAMPRTLRGVLLFFCWAVVERYNLLAAAKEQVKDTAAGKKWQMLLKS